MYINPLRISEQEFWDYCATAVCGYVKRVFPDFFRHEDLQDLTSVTATKAWLAADSYDFTKASNYQDGWCYMQFVLKYHVLDHLFVQLGLKTHGVRAEFIDAGLGVAF